MDPPPIHTQIQPHHAKRQRTDKGKGAFTKVSGTTSRKTSNYRIRTLADGRIGQRHIIQRQPVVTSEPQGDETMPPPDDPQPEMSNAADPAKKKQRVRSSNTWAVSSSRVFTPPSVV